MLLNVCLSSNRKLVRERMEFNKGQSFKKSCKELEITLDWGGGSPSPNHAIKTKINIQARPCESQEISQLKICVKLEKKKKKKSSCFNLSYSTRRR